jgi:3-isopropylmalate/(R)-2-methylmalate dehydratase small subunit
VLITQRNFGCGSSREHAAWALADYGFRVVIAPSFADIFLSNATQNGILALTLPESTVETLLKRAQTSHLTLVVDLEACRIDDGSNWECDFHVDESTRQMLLHGVDQIGQTLLYAKEIEQFEAAHAY